MVSFKISKVGTRYTPKPSPHRVQARNPLPFTLSENAHKSSQLSNGPPNGDGSAAAGGGGWNGTDNDTAGKGSDPLSLTTKRSASSIWGGGLKKKRAERCEKRCNGDSLGHIQSAANLQDDEASFAVNLFLDGFSIDRASEKGKVIPRGYEVMETLYPYDRISEGFLRAIDGGWLPGELLDDIPCTYVDGCVVCELRDYRDSIPSDSSDPVSSPRRGMFMEWIPTVRKVLLQPSTETIVKDVASMAEETWTYRDVLEVEAKILMAVQPPLCLDPTPAVAIRAYIANYNKFKFNIGNRRWRRYRMPKEALSDRRQRLAAATEALLKKGKLLKSQKFSLQRNYDDDGFNSELGALGQPQPELHGQLTTSQVSSDQFGMNRGGASLISGAMSILPVQIPSSPSSSAPATPATPSTVTSANESGGFLADMKLGSASSLVGKRDCKEFGTRTDAKKQKLEQMKLEKYHQQHQKIQLKHEVKQLRDVQRKQHQNLIQQRSSSQDLKVYRQVNHYHLDSKMMEFEVGEPVHETQQLKLEEPDQLGQEWDSVAADSKDEPVIHEQLPHSELPDENPLMIRALHTRQFGMPVSGSAQLLQWQQLGQGMERSSLKGEKGLKSGMQFPGPMRYDSLSSTGPSLTVPTGIGVCSMGTTNSSTTPPVPTMSSPGPPKSPMQVGTPSFSSPGGVGQSDPVLQSPQFSALNPLAMRRRSNSLPKIQAAPSPNSLSTSMPSPIVNSPSTGSGGPLSSPSMKGEPGLAMQASTTSQPGMGTGIALHGQKKLTGDNEVALRQAALFDVAHRIKVNSSKKSSLDKNLPFPNKNPPSFQLLAVALSNNTSDEYKEAKGHRSMANSLVGGNINARKTRFLQFHKLEQVPPGHNTPSQQLRHRTRLVLCGRGKDTMVEAVVQMGDEHDEDGLAPPHNVLPTMANPEKADQFATQYAKLMEKEGWELIEDQVQAAMPRGVSAMTNAASTARPMPAGATTLGNPVGHPGTSPRMPTNQQHMLGVPGTGISPSNPMQPNSPNALAAARMPPPTNSTRQMIGNHLGQTVAGKPMQMDVVASQLTVGQQQQQQQQQKQQQQQQHQLQHQQHQLQLQQQQQQQQQLQSQRPQQLHGVQLVAQLAAHNNSQQMTHAANQMQQLQFLQRHQQHQQHQQHHLQQQNMIQRKMMLPSNTNNLAMGMNGGSNLSGINGVGLSVSAGSQSGGISNLPGLGQMSGITNSMGGMPGLANMGQLSAMSNMGQVGGVGSMMGQQLRPGMMNNAQQTAAAAIVSRKLAVTRNRTGGTGNSPVRGTLDNLPMTATNQMHATSGLALMGQSMARPGMQAMQRAPVAAMGLQKVGTPVMQAGASGQGYYLNQQQLNAQQMATGGLGNLVGGPSSPQIGTQGLGSVPGLTSSGLQNVPRAGTLAAVTAAGRGQVRPMLPPQAQAGQPGQPSQ